MDHIILRLHDRWGVTVVTLRRLRDGDLGKLVDIRREGISVAKVVETREDIGHVKDGPFENGQFGWRR